MVKRFFIMMWLRSTVCEFKEGVSVSHPKIFLKHQVPQTNEEWQRRRFFGVARCTIVPPKKLLHPLLPFRYRGALMFPLCSKCCVEKCEDFCHHDDKERALTGTWTTIEIDKAVALGYKLLEVKALVHRSSTQMSVSFRACRCANVI